MPRNYLEKRKIKSGEFQMKMRLRQKKLMMWKKCFATTLHSYSLQQILLKFK